jgi:hypothetical protein
MKDDNGQLKKVNKEVESMLDMFIDEVLDELFVEKSYIYEGIEDYKRMTGKRYRMTKDQKQRGLTREESFIEFMKEESKNLPK